MVSLKLRLLTLALLLGALPAAAQPPYRSTQDAQDAAYSAKTRAYAWTNADVAAMSGTAGDKTMVTLPAKTIVRDAYVVIDSPGVTDKHATGTITLTGAPSPGVKSQGTLTVVDTPRVLTASQGTITLTGVPSPGVKAQGTLTIVDTPRVLTAASGTITMSDVIAGAKTFTISTQTFTWVDSRAGAGEVTRGADKAAACANLETAIDTDLSGTVTATVTDAVTCIVTVEAVTGGTGGNAIDFVDIDSGANMVFSGTGHLAGGLAADTFVVGSQTFTWQTAARAGVGQVQRGGGDGASATNAAAAITADVATTGATAAAVSAAVTVTAAAYGTAGNSITFTESSSGARMTVDAATLGTTTAGVDADTFVVGAQTFTWVDSGTATGNVVVGLTAPACVTNIVTSLTRDVAATVTAVDGTGDTVVVTAVTAGTAGNAINFTESSTNLTMDDYGGGHLGGTREGWAADTFVVGGQTFTWQTAARAGAGQVQRGAGDGASATNAAAAITADVATSTATATALSAAVTVTATVYGTAGDSITFTEATSGARTTVDGAGTLGTTTAGVEPDQFTVGAQQFTIKDTRGGVGQVTKGATAAASVTNIVAAITADLATVTAVDGAGDTVAITAVTAGTGGNALALTKDRDTGGVMAVTGSGTLTGGQDLTTFTVACGRTSTTYVDYVLASSAKASANTVYGDADTERGNKILAFGSGTTAFDLVSYTAAVPVVCHFISSGTNLAYVSGSAGRLILTTSSIP